MSSPAPLVSILITTYNRSRLLRRAVNSALMQDFTDFEIVIIDDCSPDDTRDVVASFQDTRIRYIRNETNVGSKEGDRAILRRFVYDLMRGTYFVYLCDDDYWLYPDLLSRQVDAFRSNDNVAMTMGGQLAYFLTTPESYFGHSPDDTLTVTLDNLDQFFDVETKKTKSPHFYFHGSDRPLFADGCLAPEVFLSEFAKEPTTKNIIGGAMLYSREHFIRAGALKSPRGSQWQAGYELKMGPACYGSTVYFHEPSIVTEIRGSNASFQRTQVDHYLDSILSVEIAFQTPLADPQLRDKAKFLKRVKDDTIRNLTMAFLHNSLAIMKNGELGLCSEENMRHHLTMRHVIPVLVRNRTKPTAPLRELGWTVTVEAHPWLKEPMARTISALVFGAVARSRNVFRGAWQLLKNALWLAARSLWRTLPHTVRSRVRLILGI
jgi:glycosyltransferase involved in cell wall biosynthesis